MALAIPESKCVIVVRRTGEIQRASSSVFAAISIEKFEDVARLVNKRESWLEYAFAEDKLTRTHREHNVIQKQNLIESDTLPCEILQRQQAQVPYPR
jgi:hypothetical protein